MIAEENSNRVMAAKQAIAEVRELMQAPGPSVHRFFFLLRIIWRSIEAGASTEALGIELVELCQLRRQVMPRPPTAEPLYRRIVGGMISAVESARCWLRLRRSSPEAREFYHMGVAILESSARISFEDDYLLDVLEYELKHGLISSEERAEAAKGRTRYFQKIEEGPRRR